MTHNKLTKMPFTGDANLYIDTIKPKLTDTQKSICDLVIRLTIGYHLPSRVYLTAPSLVRVVSQREL